MTPQIIVTTILNIFATTPDLCAEVYLDEYGEPWTDAIGQTLSRYCEWTGPDAPVLDADVCCTIDADVASCWLPDTGSDCQTGSEWYCEYGEAIAGGVVCYRPYPSTCDQGLCVKAPALPPDVQAQLICCDGGSCQNIWLSCRVCGCSEKLIEHREWYWRPSRAV